MMNYTHLIDSFLILSSCILTAFTLRHCKIKKMHCFTKWFSGVALATACLLYICRSPLRVFFIDIFSAG